MGNNTAKLDTQQTESEPAKPLQNPFIVYDPYVLKYTVNLDDPNGLAFAQGYVVNLRQILDSKSEDPLLCEFSSEHIQTMAANTTLSEWTSGSSFRTDGNYNKIKAAINELEVKVNLEK